MRGATRAEDPNSVCTRGDRRGGHDNRDVRGEGTEERRGRLDPHRKPHTAVHWRCHQSSVDPTRASDVCPETIVSLLGGPLS